jgi:outer membrane receptor protein involved in Fe transport
MRTAFAAMVAVCLLAAPMQAQDREDATPQTEIEVVTPSGSKKKFLDTADAVTTLNRRQIEERGSGQMPDLLEGATGVYGQHTAHGQGSPFIRGMTGKQILMLVDGVRFNNSTFRFGPNQYYSSIDPFSIDRIEVIRGPSSVLYGSDALGGVINVIMRKPVLDAPLDYTFGGRGRFESASMCKQLGLFGEVGASNFGALLSATYADVDELVGGASIGRMPATAYEEWGVHGSMGYDFGAHRLTLSYQHFQQNDLERTDSVSPVVANPSLIPGGPSNLRRRFVFQIDDLAILRWQLQTDSVLEELSADISYHKQQETVERITSGSPNTLRDANYNVHTMGGRIQAILNFHKLARLTVGTELYHDIVHTRSVDINRTTGEQTNHHGRIQFPDWSSYTTFGLYAQNETSLIDDRLQFRYGVRYSLYRALADLEDLEAGLPGLNEGFSDITGALAIVGKPTNCMSLTLNLARGFRAPNLDDLAAALGTGRGEQIPNPELDPETQYTADIGAKAWLATVDPDSAAPYEMMGSVNFFFHYLEDLMVSVPTTFNSEDVVQIRNAGRARIFGVEAEFGFYLSQVLDWVGLPSSHLFFEGDALGVHANFTYTRGDDLKNEVPVHRIPPVFSEVSVRYSAMRGQVYIEPYMTIVGRQDQYAPAALGDVRFTPHDAPGYVLLGLRTGWYPSRHVKLNLNIQNIGNRSYHPMGSGTFGSGTNVVLTGELRW